MLKQPDIQQLYEPLIPFLFSGLAPLDPGLFSLPISPSFQPFSSSNLKFFFIFDYIKPSLLNIILVNHDAASSAVL